MRLGNPSIPSTSGSGSNKSSSSSSSSPVKVASHNSLFVVKGCGMSLKRSASDSSSTDDQEAEARQAKRRATTQQDPPDGLPLGLGTVAVARGLQASPSTALQRQQHSSAALLQALTGSQVPSPALSANTGTNHQTMAALLDSVRRGNRPPLPLAQGENQGLLGATLGTSSRTLSQEQIQNLLRGGLSSTPRPALAAASTANVLGTLESEAQALLAASRLRQAQASLPTLSLPQNYSSLLPSFPASAAGSALGLSPMGNLGAASAATTLESQLRAAQLMALQSQLSPPSSAAATGQVDPALMLLGRHAPMLAAAPARAAAATPSLDPPVGAARGRSAPLQEPPKKKPTETLLAVPGELPPAIPPAVEGSTPHYNERATTIINMSTDEDQNWLSEFQCFIRSEVLEVFRASAEDVQIRNNSKTLQTQQIGIRCRFCAHLPPSSRASRSSAFPSSIPQIYQSFTMMLRDHWTACQSIPSPQKEKFMEFKTKNNQGASDSKNYWMHAARRTGMVNTAQGIDVNDASRAAAARIPPFGTNSDTSASLQLEKEDTEPLVLPEDKALLKDEYSYVLLQQVQRVRLSASERVGNRKSLRIGLPGFGCRYCCQAGRLGLSRIFPARRRTLPSKIPDIHDHLRRCPLCPQSVKDELQELEDKRKQNQEEETDAEGRSLTYASSKEKEFFTRIWSRLGHGNKPEPSS